MCIFRTPKLSQPTDSQQRFGALTDNLPSGLRGLIDRANARQPESVDRRQRFRALTGNLPGGLRNLIDQASARQQESGLGNDPFEPVRSKVKRRVYF